MFFDLFDWNAFSAIQLGKSFAHPCHEFDFLCDLHQSGFVGQALNEVNHEIFIAHTVGLDKESNTARQVCLDKVRLNEKSHKLIHWQPLQARDLLKQLQNPVAAFGITT